MASYVSVRDPGYGVALQNARRIMSKKGQGVGVGVPCFVDVIGFGCRMLGGISLENQYGNGRTLRLHLL